MQHATGLHISLAWQLPNLEGRSGPPPTSTGSDAFESDWTGESDLSRTRLVPKLKLYKGGNMAGIG